MKRKIILIATVVLLLSFLSIGCGREVTSEKQEIAEIIIGEGSEFLGGFNILSGYDTSGFYHYTPNIYETLVLYDKKGVKPGLAESWEIKENKITFKLREKVRFSDGAELTADVVKLNFDTMKATVGEQMAWFAGVSKLQEVNVIDKYMVEFIYDTPYIVALQDFTASVPMAIMSPNAFENGGVSENINTETMGTGPYKLESFEEGKYYTFIRNEGYWGEKPEVEKFTVKIISDMEARMLALRTGEIDIVYGSYHISQDAFVEFKDDDNFFTKVAEDVFSTRNILLNTSRPPFDDKKVRLAVQHAVNKDIICDKLLYGLEEKADYLLHPNLPYCDVKVEPYVYDMDKARELLKSAGWIDIDGDGILEKKGKKLEAEVLFRAGWGMEEDICQAMSTQLRKVGFEVKATGLDGMAWYGKALEGDFDATVNDTYGVPYDPHTFLSPMLSYSADNPAQQGLAEKAEIDRCINNIFNTIDTSIIQDNYNYVLSTLHEGALNLPISYTKDSIVFNKEKISDYEFWNQTREFNVGGIELK